MRGPDDGKAVSLADQRLESYARLVARLAHRFADRAAILETRRLDERAYDRLEHEAMETLDEAVRARSSDTLLAFAQAFADARRGLMEPETLDGIEPPTAAAPTRYLGTPASAAGRTRSSPPQADDGDTVDVLDLMETLHSSAGGRPPSST
jgi:Rad3-related DNA helicase